MKKLQLLMMICIISLQLNGQGLLDEATTIYLVRHAEKAADGTADPKLSEAGKERTISLVYTLQEDTLDAVFSTNTLRTKSTGYPIADYNNLEVRIYDPRNQHLFLKKVIKQFKGKTILIVGHSNTIPKLLNLLLGKEKYQQFKEYQYNDLFMAETIGLGQSKVHHFKYGKLPEKPSVYNVDEDKVAVQGYDVVSYFEDEIAEEGTSFYWTTYDGAIYHFASKQHLQLFVENPRKYLPKYGGWCAYGMSLDKSKDGYTPNKYPIDPESFMIIEGELYLFYNAGGYDALKLWEKDEAVRLERANKFWDKIVQQSK